MWTGAGGSVGKGNSTQTILHKKSIFGKIKKRGIETGPWDIQGCSELHRIALSQRSTQF